MKQKLLLCLLISCLVIIDITCSDLETSSEKQIQGVLQKANNHRKKQGPPSQHGKTKVKLCTNKFIARLTCYWKKRTLSVAEKKKFDGFDCQDDVIKQIKMGKKKCSLSKDFFENFRSSLRTIKHFKENSVDKLLKEGSVQIQDKMKKEIKAGLKKKAVLQFVSGLKHCEILPEQFRLKLEHYVENMSYAVSASLKKKSLKKLVQKKSGKPKAILKNKPITPTVDAFIMPLIRAMVRKGFQAGSKDGLKKSSKEHFKKTDGKMSFLQHAFIKTIKNFKRNINNAAHKKNNESDGKTDQNENQQGTMNNAVNKKKNQLDEQKKSKKLNKNQPPPGCMCGGPCAGSAEAANHVVKIIYQYKPQTQIKSTAARSQRGGVLNNSVNELAKPIKKAGSSLSDFLGSGIKLDKVEMARMKSRKLFRFL
jgi:hypothetical protein